MSVSTVGHSIILSLNYSCDFSFISFLTNLILPLSLRWLSSRVENIIFKYRNETSPKWSKIDIENSYSQLRLVWDWGIVIILAVVIKDWASYGSDEPSCLCLDCVLALENLLNTYKYLVPNIITKTSYGFCGKFRNRKLQILVPPLTVIPVI